MRVISFLLVFVLVMGTVYARSFSDIRGNPYDERIEFLSDIGVLNGYADGSFKPNQVVNRAELLKIVYAALAEGADGSAGN